LVAAAPGVGRGPQQGIEFLPSARESEKRTVTFLERINDPKLESPVTSVLGMIDHVEVVDPRAGGHFQRGQAHRAGVQDSLQPAGRG